VVASSCPLWECTGAGPPPAGTASPAARAQLLQKPLGAVVLHPGEGLAIDARRTLVRPHPLPRLLKDVIPPEMVIQRVKAPPRCPLGCRPQSPLQLSHLVARPLAAGVVRSGLAGHSRALTRSDDTTAAGTRPSRRVLPHGVRSRSPRPGLRYPGPLGLPLHSGRVRLRLIRHALPRRGPCRRASRVPRPSVHACRAPYPAETRRAFRTQRGGRGLRRDMSGSALGLFMCRGCRLHVMLRPACLLPAEQLVLPHGLLTPRSSAKVSLGRMGPATRRSGAYRGGTLTRWKSAARNGSLAHSAGEVSRFVTAHHGVMLSALALTGKHFACIYVIIHAYTLTF